MVSSYVSERKKRWTVAGTLTVHDCKEETKNMT